MILITCLFFLLIISPGNASETCLFKAPLGISISGNHAFKKYVSTKTETDTTESGEFKDGTLFSVSRGGCRDFGEDFSFEFDSQNHDASEVKFWLSKIYLTIKLLISGNENKTGAILSKTEAIKKLSQAKTPYLYGDTIKVGDDTFEIYVNAARKGRMKTTLTITDSL